MTKFDPNALPAAVRAKLYGVLAVVFLVTGSVDTGVATIIAAGVPVPLWLTLGVAVVTKVALFVAAATNYTALTHTPSTEAEVENVDVDRLS